MARISRHDPTGASCCPRRCTRQVKRAPSLLTQCGSILVDPRSITPHAAKAPKRASVLNIAPTFARRRRSRRTPICVRESPPMAHPAARRHHAGRMTVRRVGAGLAMAAVVGWTGAAPAAASSGGGRRITDTANNRTVYLVCIALVALAAALAVFTWWFWRNTRRDPEALGPLEVMGERDYVDGDPTVRQTLLDANRPVGAAPVLVGATDPLLVEPDVEPPAAPERPLEPATATTDAFADNSGIDPALGEQTKLLEVAPSAPAATGDDATTAIAVVGNGSHPIDPGLPRTVDDTGGMQLSLAELASL